MNKSLFLLVIFIFVNGFAYSQEQTDIAEYQKAELHRANYRFEKALDIYRSLIGRSKDSAFIDNLALQIARSENGLRMLEYASKPTPTGFSDVHKTNFMLFIPKQEGYIWAPLPEILGKNRLGFIPNNFVYTKQNADTIYFSALNDDKNYDIYSTYKINDTLWHTPQSLGNLINSPGDEILPILSKDGKSLYFASNGHYGIGGFDIYVCQLDELTGEWGLPQNIGYPYSSPGDDYLYFEDNEELYSYLVSNRNIAAHDSVRIYRLESELNPVKRSIDDPDEALEISRLIPYQTKPSETKQQDREVPDTGDYPILVKAVRKIQGDIDSTLKSLNNLRDTFISIENIEKRAELEEKITSGEIYMSDLREQLRIATKAVQSKEMEFFEKGILIPRDIEPEQAPQHEHENNVSLFITIKSTPGNIKIDNLFIPEIPVDYSFRIEKSSIIFNEIPSNGLIYRIQLAVTVNKAAESAFKGITPIFEIKAATGRWLYTAGNFTKHSDAVAALSVVKNRGFKSAIIVAYNNGKSISLQKAREAEEKIDSSTSYQVKITGFTEDLPASIITTIKALTDKDIARKPTSTALFEYYIGPFGSVEEAEEIERALNTVGVSGVSIEEIIKSK